MSTHPEFQDLMVEALFDEIDSEDRRRLENHLATCEACAEEFESLQDTLDVMATRERPDLPDAYWDSYRRRLHRKRSGSSSSPLDRLRAWWNDLPVILPQTSGQWALQGAVAVAVLVAALWLFPNASVQNVTPRPSSETPSATVTDLLLARESVSAELGRAAPIIQSIDDVSYDPQNGSVSVRYRTVNSVVARGSADDPALQRLLRTALLDGNNPASQLHAMKTLEQASIAPSDDLVHPLTYLARKSDNPDLRVRALRALRSLHATTSLDSSTQSVLVGLLLDTSTPTGLRVEALQTLTATTSDLDPSVLYPVRNDSNAYVRYQARSSLQRAQFVDTELSPPFP